MKRFRIAGFTLCLMWVGACATPSAKAKSLYEKRNAQCYEDDNGWACGWLGAAFRDGEAVVGGEIDKGTAMAYWDRGCELEDAFSCMMQSDRRKIGEATPKAIAVMKAHCSAGEERSMYSCLDVGRHLQWAKPKPTSTEVYAEWYKKACLAGHERGCFAYAGTFGPTKRETIANETLVRPWIEKACELNEGYCARLGLYEFWWGNKDKGLALASTRCDADHSFGCLIKWDIGRERSDLEKACELRSGQGCRLLSCRTKDRDTRFELQHRSCEYGDMSGCVDFSNSLIKMGAIKSAAERAQPACDKKRGFGCWTMARIAKGKGDVTESKRLFESASRHSLDRCLNKDDCAELYLTFHQEDFPKERSVEVPSVIEERCFGKEECQALERFDPKNIGGRNAFHYRYTKHRCENHDDLGLCNTNAWNACFYDGKCDEEVLAVAKKAASNGESYSIDTLAFVECKLGRVEASNATYAKACSIGKKTCGICSEGGVVTKNGKVQEPGSCECD